MQTKMKVVVFQEMMSDHSLLPPMAHPRHRAPSPTPSPSPSPSPTSTSTSTSTSSSSSSRQPVDFSPPLIAMVVVVAAAFIVVTYCRLISRRLINPMLHLVRRRRRRLYLPSTITDSPPPPPPPPVTDYYGLDDAAIKTLPLSIYRPNNSPKECAVCLVEFGGQEYVRTLPVCSHAFHVDCIDVWLKSQANCPLCRAAIFVPLMAARISPSLDAPTILIRPDPTPEITTEEASSNFDCHHHQEISRAGFHFSLKRSYSFGFERRLVTEAQTASPWRKRMSSSPFLGSLKPRVMSFRYSHCRGMKAASPLLIRRRILCRRSKWMAGSPMSSRMRCGDPEALVSPERLNRGR